MVLITIITMINNERMACVCGRAVFIISHIMSSQRDVYVRPTYIFIRPTYICPTEPWLAIFAVNFLLMHDDADNAKYLAGNAQ